MNRDKLCPYVNGICEDRSRGTINGWCVLIGERCERIENYSECPTFRGKLYEIRSKLLNRPLYNGDRNSLQGGGSPE